jgi:3-dehydroquinate synthase
VFGYGKFLHGEAIAIGMTCAARLAEQLGLVGPELRARQTKLFQAVGLPTDCPAEYHEALIIAMKRDKKVSGGKLKLILPTKLGVVEQVAAPGDDLIRQSLLNDPNLNSGASCSEL